MPPMQHVGMTRRRGSLVGGLVRGAIAGGAATWVMDQLTTGMMQGQADEKTEQEEAARPRGQAPDLNLVDHLDRRFELRLDENGKSRLALGIHYGLGIVPGALYGALRRRLPFIGAWRGLLFGLVLFLLNDEYLNAKLGLAGPPQEYPAETHTRGLLGHLALGAATDTGVDVLGG
jgi:uncharacterized membrane protein YagU involved in acid resistance